MRALSSWQHCGTAGGCQRAVEERIQGGGLRGRIGVQYYHCTRSDQFDFLLLYLSPPFSDSGRTLTSRFCMVLGTMCEILKRIRGREQEVHGPLRAKQKCTIRNPFPRLGVTRCHGRQSGGFCLRLGTPESELTLLHGEQASDIG